jgi:hypothetical protein
MLLFQNDILSDTCKDYEHSAQSTLTDQFRCAKNCGKHPQTVLQFLPAMLQFAFLSGPCETVIVSSVLSREEPFTHSDLRGMPS